LSNIAKVRLTIGKKIYWSSWGRAGDARKGGGVRGRKAKRAVAGVTAMAWHGNDGVLSAGESLLLRMRRRRRECMDGLCNALRQRRRRESPGLKAR